MLTLAGVLSILSVIFRMIHFMSNGSMSKIGGCLMILVSIGVLLFGGFVTLLLMFA